VAERQRPHERRVDLDHRERGRAIVTRVHRDAVGRCVDEALLRGGAGRAPGRDEDFAGEIRRGDERLCVLPGERHVRRHRPAANYVLAT